MNREQLNSSDFAKEDIMQIYAPQIFIKGKGENRNEKEFFFF